MDMSRLSPENQASIATQIAGLLEMQESKARVDSLIEANDWAAIERFARAEHRNPPEQFVPRKTYKTVAFYQNVSFGFPGNYENPLWPVIMRGSRWSMMLKRGDKRLNLSDDIFNRWLRMKKITAYDHADFWGQAEQFDGKLRAKYGSRQRNDKDYWHFNPDRGRECRRVYISGHEKVLTAWQHSHIMALREIIKKTDKLERRIAMMREWRIEAQA